MNCIDCHELICESERLGARACRRCKSLMHGECSMSTPTDEDSCERCYYLDGMEFASAMKKRGVEA